MHDELRLYRRLVADAASPLPPTMPVGTDCATAVARLRALAVSTLLVVDDAGRPVGVLTEQDVVRRIAFQLPAGAPVEGAMAPPPPSVPASSRLYRAVAQMRRQQLRHLLVTEPSGRPVGLLEHGAALDFLAAAVSRRIDLLAREITVEGLAGTKAAQPTIAAELLDDGAPAAEIQGLLTDINCDLYRHLLERALAAMADEGWGEPPVDFCALVMGSAGRGENYLDPDQDNGFILADYPDDAHGAVDRYFVELAERTCRDLDAVGIPYCSGGVMATSPVWRKTLPQWVEQISGWARRPTSSAALNADIFFDFQPVHGDLSMAMQLRGKVAGVPKRNRPLLQAMAADNVAHNVSLSLFGRLVTEGDDTINRGRIELKLHGTQPLIGCTRLMALAAGIEQTSTLDRIGALGDQGVLARREVDALNAAYRHVAHLRLRQQVADHRAGHPPGDHVVVAALTEQDRTLLADALRAIDRLRKRVEMDLIGQAA